MKKWFDSGSPWIWLTAGAVSLCLIMVVGLLSLITWRGLEHFWPSDIYQFEYKDAAGSQKTVIGQIYDQELVPVQRLKDIGIDLKSDDEVTTRYLIRTGNRDILGLDFRWLVDDLITERSMPKDLMVAERREWGNFYGYPVAVKSNGEVIASGDNLIETMNARLARADVLHAKIREIEVGEIGKINYQLEKLRLNQRSLELDNELTEQKITDFAAKRKILQADYKELEDRLIALYGKINSDVLVGRTMSGLHVDISFAKLVRVYQPNAMNASEKIGIYFDRLNEFVFDDPREANTEGGVFPAIFGTVLMVMLMAVIVTPFGVIAAIYLKEYAHQGLLTRMIRIAVINLAGVPSIVYGVFGLGFFVYMLGGQLDQLFYAEALPSPTFGTPGIIWSAITLALLTVPVVIVATEEGLNRIPRAIREGSMALGATKAETLWRVVLPMASPAMITGLILAVARAAGEVAPLMLVGVVKLAPSLPLDGNSPFLHLDRKFMHLGFHIYDVGFQSPNVEAARPLVFATALLLVLVIIFLNLAAIRIRNNLREKYRALES
ncbi:phosphate ABC transporter permease PstA [Pelagibaculum spongiae]|uniref:Phosphate transport system permease protein PstA n=1 Tax=Pelagibaculum spongiae TaxID=2080658 RepID=A0A2V1H1X2_9GAMM|nr:phosphate ABC transporter permease PstA [Pelagibaculum spongiae]PVZ69680.1 phosphate ABC transporter permease PtsA [Pelagibaculum spongiae]